MSQTKTQMVKSSFGGHLSPIVHAGSSSSASSTPSHGDEDAMGVLNFGHFGLNQNLHLYKNWSTQNSNNNENSSSTSSSSSSNWSAVPADPGISLDELLKNSAQSEAHIDSNWSPFSSMQQQQQQQQQQQHQSTEMGAQWAAWSPEAEFADWASKKPQQVPPQAQSKSWAKIVSQQSSPCTNGPGQATNAKGEMSHDWDIKVNQTVPWNLEAGAQSQSQTVVPSSSTSSAASSSSSSASSISANDKLVNSLLQLNKEKGTEIWLGNPTKTLWEQKEAAEAHSWSPNQQAPQWNVGWNEPWSADQALVQQQHHQQLMAKIEPTGWEDPDFKQSKKSDDGTAIWGDPEQSKLVKILKWSYSTKHVPNPATAKPDADHASQWKSLQSQSSTSSWNNTPAAPVLNEQADMKMSSEWNSDLVDAKSWPAKENKSEHEWDQGRVDTSSWGINIASTKNNFDPSIGVVDTSKWSSGTQGVNPASQVITSKPNSQVNTPGLLNMTNTGSSSQDWNSNMLRDEEARKLGRINSHPSSGNMPTRPANKMPANFANQTPSVAQPSGLLGNNLSQSQLLESYQLAVQTNLISPDLLNNKLPSDVLALLNQLFQTLNLYTNSINRINNLTKRGAHLNPQYKSEFDQLKQENQTHKENLLLYQKRINAAHMLLKQQQQQQQQQQQHQFAGASNLIGNLTAGEINNMCDMPSMISKESQNQKLMQMFHEQKMAQYVATQKPINGQNQLNKVSNSLFNHSSTPLGAAGQWTGFNSLMGERQPQIDDRITPFVPGKPWAGHGQPSIEDDPNCTPGSFSKPLLTETIDPESILSNLTRGNNWSNNVDFLGANQTSLLGLNNNGQNRFGQRNTWGQNNFNSLNNSMDSSTGTIGEQLWGVRNNSSRNGMNANSPSNINRNGPGQFNPLMNSQQQQQQQQQFYRSNSWNIGASGNNAFNNPSQLNINNGYYLLIRNVTPQIDQTILKGLCSQYANGQLTYFKYIPHKSSVIVRYNTKEETNKAHAKLNSISLGNTTINTQMISESDIKFELL